MTQKELILAWGKGEAGHMEQLASLSMEELILTYRQLKAIGITSRVDNLKMNLALVIRAVRQRFQQETPLYYIACGNNDYPYQESSNYGVNKIDTNMLSIRVFPDEKAAETVAEVINRNTNALGEKRGRPVGNIVHVARLGDGYNMTNVQNLERLGVAAVSFGEHKDDKTDLNLRSETLVRKDNTGSESFDFFNVAPKAYAQLCIIEQAQNEKRPEEEIQLFRMTAFEAAAANKIGVAISQADYEKGECNPLTVEYEGSEHVELFTDWASMMECRGESRPIYMAVGTWEDIISFDKPVIINREAVLPLGAVKQFGNFTKTGRMAMAYIAYCYNLNTNSPDGLERDTIILNDIRKAEPVWQEFRSGLSIVTKQNEEGKNEQFVVFNFPEGELFSVNGNTAKQFYENKLCDTPAAAYHVLAALYNDTDGSSMKAFENAELYE